MCCALTYLSGACFIAFRCVHPFTGKKVCSLWCGYCIVYCAIPDRDPSFVNTMLLISGTLSLLPERGMAHPRSRHTITEQFRCYPDLCLLHRQCILICSTCFTYTGTLHLHHLLVSRFRSAPFLCFGGSLRGASAGIAAFTSCFPTYQNTGCSCYFYAQHLHRCHCEC